MLRFSRISQGFVLSRQPVDIRDSTCWSLTPGENCLRYEFAGRRVFGDWSPWARRLLQAPLEADWLEYVDRGTGVYRAAHLVDDRIQGCVFLSPRPDLPARSWVSSLFAKAALEDADRAGLLLGQHVDATADSGAAICSCFGVGRNTIGKAIRDFDLHSAEEIGQRVRAGTNCGSCLPEQRAILKSEHEAMTI